MLSVSSLAASKETGIYEMAAFSKMNSSNINVSSSLIFLRNQSQLKFFPQLAKGLTALLSRNSRYLVSLLHYLPIPSFGVKHILHLE